MKINREKLVSRNSPVLTEVDDFSPFTVGNGSFAFTTDITGFQSFPENYVGKIPLETMANDFWHDDKSFEKSEIEELDGTEFLVKDRVISYYAKPGEKKELYNYLRENPHKFHMGNIGLVLKDLGGDTLKISDLTKINQRLDLYTGVIESSFVADGEPVLVKTCVHPEKYCVAFEVQSRLLNEKRAEIELRLFCPSPEPEGCDLNDTESGESYITLLSDKNAVIKRSIDDTRYNIFCYSENGFTVDSSEKNKYGFSFENTERVSFSVLFSKEEAEVMCGFAEVEKLSAGSFAEFWSTVGIADFSGCDDVRARELERREILSMYLLKIQCCGDMPPQETGLTLNSWYGKSHLEMHFWHTAWLLFYGKEKLFEKSLEWYKGIMPQAKKIAERQGYKGVRWPKMVDREGIESPSPVAPYLVWQQPHPIFYAEALYNAQNQRSVLEKYSEMVFETAEFISDFMEYDSENDRYNISAPVIPAQENYHPDEVLNPVYELEYFKYGLDVANKWKKRLGLEENPKWKMVSSKIAIPSVCDGLYRSHERCTETYGKKATDHPSMLCALGVLNGRLIDKEVMKNTFCKVKDCWDFRWTWGWDFPVMAMTAARLGMTDEAIDSLLMDADKNRYFKNGHCFQMDKILPIYLPANGGFLLALGMMLAGFDGGEYSFPQGWNVKYENIRKYSI